VRSVSARWLPAVACAVLVACGQAAVLPTPTAAPPAAVAAPTVRPTPPSAVPSASPTTPPVAIPTAVAAPAAPATTPTALARPAARSTAASSAPFAYGVAAGDMTADSAVLWTRAAVPGEVVAEVSESEGFERPTALPAIQATDATDLTVKVSARGLKPGTRYFYRFRAGGQLSPVGQFRTAFAPDQAAPLTFAFSGDADWEWKPYPVLNALVKEKLDFFLFLGDLIYETTDLQGRTDVEDLAGYRWKYRENREPRDGSPSKMVPMLDLYRLFGQYSVFDNHEIGVSRADRAAPPFTTGGAKAGDAFVNRTPGFLQRVQAYREYQPVRDETVAGTGDPRLDGTGRFYRAIPWGANAELIVLDDRSYRDAAPRSPDDPDATSCARTMLGAPQLKWFQDELLAAKARKVAWTFVVVSSPIQQLGTPAQLGVRAESGIDGVKSWSGGYLCERNKLLRWIDDNAIDDVVFLSTDNHYTVVNNLRYNVTPDDRASPTRPARNAVEIITGPIGAATGPPAIGRELGEASRDLDKLILDLWNNGLRRVGLEPIKDGSFMTFSYAVLSADADRLSVTVKGLPAVTDQSTLLDPEKEREYEARQAREILRFELRAGARL
jgi:alkaline phosphatase D